MARWCATNNGWLNAGINDSGLCVGYNTGGNIPDSAVIWQSGNANATNINGYIQTALVSSDDCLSYAVAVNNSGQIVGHYATAADIDDNNAFLYNSSTNIVNLGNLGGPGGGSLIGTSALAINDKGYVVGTSPTAGTAGQQHAFLWTPTSSNGTAGSMVDLNNELDERRRRIPSGLYLYEATGINGARSICGYLSNSSQTQFQAFALIATLPGDANLDGRVDVNDLTIVLSHFGQTGAAWAQGEFTGDGKVDVNDLTIVLANFGQSGGSSAGMAAVPEPASMAMLAALLLAAAWTANFWKRFHT